MSDLLKEKDQRSLFFSFFFTETFIYFLANEFHPSVNTKGLLISDKFCLILLTFIYICLVYAGLRSGELEPVRIMMKSKEQYNLVKSYSVHASQSIITERRYFGS